MPDASPTCPRCQSANQVHKVSLLFIDAQEYLSKQGTGTFPDLEGVLEQLQPSGGDPSVRRKTAEWLAHALAPPEYRRQTGLAQHPDLIAGVFGFLCLLALAVILIQQQPAFPAALVTLGAGAAVYLLLRKKLLFRHHRDLERKVEERQRQERASGRYMRLFFCSRERCIFDPTQEISIPIEQIHDLLFAP